MKIMFKSKVKYKGAYYPANSEFEIDPADMPEMIGRGGVLIGDGADKTSDALPKKAKTAPKKDG